MAPDGAAGSPSYSFTSDPDTGIYREGTNNIGFAVGGHRRMNLVHFGGYGALRIYDANGNNARIVWNEGNLPESTLVRTTGAQVIEGQKQMRYLFPTYGRPADVDYPAGGSNVAASRILVFDQASSTPNGPGFFGSTLHVAGASNRIFQLSASTGNNHTTFRIRSIFDQTLKWNPWVDIVVSEGDQVINGTKTFADTLIIPVK